MLRTEVFSVRIASERVLSWAEVMRFSGVSVTSAPLSIAPLTRSSISLNSLSNPEGRSR